jgi:hypothetical protein
VYSGLPRRFYPKMHLTTANFQHFEFDLVVNHNRLAGSSGKHQHLQRPRFINCAIKPALLQAFCDPATVMD